MIEELPSKEQANGEIGIIVRDGVAGIRAEGDEYLERFRGEKSLTVSLEDTVIEDNEVKKLFGVMPAEEIINGIE